MSRLETIFKDIQQDLKLYVFILGVFCLFRIGFIVILKSYISESTTLHDIATALYYGIRISLKSTGMATLVSLILCTGVGFFIKSKAIQSIRYVVGCLYISVLSLLFYARIPYYEQFHIGFNQLLFNTFNDDVTAIFYTLVQQYNLPMRLVMTAITGLILSKLLHLWLSTRTYHLPHFPKWYQNIAFRASLLAFCYYMMIFIRFGGSMTYAYNIDWENSGVTKDEFLNEAILDDVQALCRAYTLHERVAASTGLDIDSGKIIEYGTSLADHQILSHHIDDFFEKKAQGPLIARPQHIFLIIGESYANWPLLPKYQDLNIANGVKNLIAQDNSAYVSTFLPNGMSTIAGVMGVVTGLAEANLYLTYLPESYKEPYSTAIAPQMRNLGYKPRFWYAGPNSWERVKDFTLAQGFDDFHGLGDIDSQSGNVWGCDDKYLFRTVAAGIDHEQSTFNVILNISNHSPYTVNLQEEGFDDTDVINALPEEQRNDKELIKKLGHFWYADKILTDFIHDTEEKYPDSLFIVVGDHADRVNIDKNPSLYERYGIPFVLYGKGITKNMLPDNAAGSHINITPTLMELIAPKDFVYHSLGKSLTRGNTLAFNYGFWMNHDYINKIGGHTIEQIPRENQITPPNEELIQEEIDAQRALSWWRVKYGKNIE